MKHGKVIIGCNLETKELEKDLSKSKRDLEKFEAEEKKLLSTKEKLELEIEIDESKLIQSENKIEKLKRKINETKVGTPEYERMTEKLDEMITKNEFDNKKLALKEKKLKNINTLLTENKNNQQRLNTEISEMEKKLKLPSVNIDKINNGLSQTLKKVARWGLALFGIRTAYNAIRGAMSTLSQYDTQMADNIEYIRYSLASSLQPVIQTILNLVVRLLQYINYIAKAWTGKNLFKTADAFKSAQKSASGVAKSAKEINKQLAGFDEMNVLSDTSSGGAGGGGADITAPNIDLTGMQGEVPEWLKWIVDNKDLILSIFAGVAAGLLAWKLGLSGIKSLGIGLAIAGVIYAIQSIIKYLQDPSFENFGKIITGIGVAVAGVAIIFGAWPVAIAGAMVAIIGIIISNWEKIKTFLQNGIEWLKTSGKDILNWLFGDFLNPLYDAFVNNLQLILNFFDTTFTNAKKILDNIIEFVKNVFAGNWKGAWENIKNIFFAIFDTIKNYFFTVFGIIKNTVVGIAGTVGNILAGVFKAVVNGVMGAIESILNSPIRAVNRLIGVINKVPGINLGTLSTFKLPRLAKGGIINQPGRGVPIGYGQAIGGENKMEGVIPLTDSQQMQLLGQSIGKYVNINLTNITKLDNRQIAKEQRRINAQSDFAFNR